MITRQLKVVTDDKPASGNRSRTSSRAPRSVSDLPECASLPRVSLLIAVPLSNTYLIPTSSPLSPKELRSLLLRRSVGAGPLLYHSLATSSENLQIALNQQIKNQAARNSILEIFVRRESYNHFFVFNLRKSVGHSPTEQHWGLTISSTPDSSPTTSTCRFFLQPQSHPDCAQSYKPRDRLCCL